MSRRAPPRSAWHEPLRLIGLELGGELLTHLLLAECFGGSRGVLVLGRRVSVWEAVASRCRVPSAVCHGDGRLDDAILLAFEGVEGLIELVAGVAVGDQRRRVEATRSDQRDEPVHLAEVAESLA
jgi:hypothetical protein